MILIVLYTAASLAAADFGTPAEAKAKLERAVAAVKEDEAKALDMFNTWEGGFKPNGSVLRTSAFISSGWVVPLAARSINRRMMAALSSTAPSFR